MAEQDNPLWARAVDLNTNMVVGRLPYQDPVGSLYDVGGTRYVKISTLTIGKSPVVCLREFDAKAKYTIDLKDKGTIPLPFEHTKPPIYTSKRIIGLNTKIIA